MNKTDSIVRVVGRSVGVGAVLLAIVLAWRVFYHGTLPNQIVRAVESLNIQLKVVTWGDLENLQKKAKEYRDLQKDEEKLKNHLRRAIDDVKNQVDPGPRPDWYWHPIDWWDWPEKEDLYLGATEELRKTKHDLADKEQRANDLLTWSNGIFSDPEKVNRITTLISPVRKFWNNVIAPVLEIGLIIACFRFGIRVFFRAALISGLIRTTRL